MSTGEEIRGPHLSVELDEISTATAKQGNDSQAELYKERRASQARANEMAEQEKQRRMDELKSEEEEAQVVRLINVEYSNIVAEEERERRVRESQIMDVQEQLVRLRHQSEANVVAEQERQRRIVEDQNLPKGHFRSSSVVLQSSISQLPNVRDRSGSAPVSSDIANSMSEIALVRSSKAKITVDENTEWQCSILSDDPGVEKDNLKALHQSLESDLTSGVASNYPDVVGQVRLLRFLRGYKDVNEAALRYRRMLQLREMYQLDAIRANIEDKNLIPEMFPHYNKISKYLPFLSLYDVPDADPSLSFYFELSGYADVQGFSSDVSDEEWTTFFLYDMEYRSMKLDQLSRQREVVVQTVFVRDLQGLRLSSLRPAIFRRIQNVMSLGAACYPETMKETLFLNVPWVFLKPWEVLASTLQGTQVSKISMGDDTFERLVSYVGSRAQLPRILGGKHPSLNLPRTGLLGKDNYAILCDDGAVQSEVKAGGLLQLPFRVSAGDTVCWEFALKELDIDFSVVSRTQGEGGAVENVQHGPTRFSSGDTTHHSVTATEDGTIVLTWDNTFSWARSKTVAYKATVVRLGHKNEFSYLDTSDNDCV